MIEELIREVEEKIDCDDSEEAEENCIQQIVEKEIKDSVKEFLSK